MKRLIEKTVLVGLVTACRLATVPTSRSPLCANATTDGVVRPPSAFSMTVGSPPSRTAMHEFVVPRSMPIVFAMLRLLLQDLSLLGADLSASSAAAPSPSGTSGAGRIPRRRDVANDTCDGRAGAGSRAVRAPGRAG